MKNTITQNNWQAMPGALQPTDAVLQLDLGYTFHKLFIDLGDTTTNPTLSTAISQIQLLINGQPQRVWQSVQDMIKENEYFGEGTFASNTRYLLLSFDRQNMRKIEGQELTSLYSGPQILDANGQSTTGKAVQSITLRITYDGSQVVAPSLSAWAVVSNLQSGGLIRKRQLYTQTVTGAGQIQFYNTPKGEPIMLMTFLLPATLLTRLQLLRNNVLEFDRLADLNTYIESTTGSNRRVPDNTYAFRLDPSEQGDDAETIATTQVTAVSNSGTPQPTVPLSSLIITLYISGIVPNNACPIYVETLGAIN